MVNEFRHKPEELQPSSADILSESTRFLFGQVLRKLNIGFDTTDKSHRLQQSVCSMLNAASRNEEKAISNYRTTYGQADMAGVNQISKDKIRRIISDKERHYNDLFDIARDVGCEIYESNGEEVLISKRRDITR